MANKKSKNSRKKSPTEKQFILDSERIKRSTKIITILIDKGFTTATWFILYLIIDTIFEKAILESCNINLELSSKITLPISILLGGGAIVYGTRQKKIAEQEKKNKEDATKNLGDKLKYVEKLLDKNRSSSNLTSSGKTNPEDL